MPAGGNKWLLKMYLSLNHSFKRFVQNTDSCSNETSEVFEWVIESSTQEIHSENIDLSSNRATIEVTV